MKYVEKRIEYLNGVKKTPDGEKYELSAAYGSYAIDKQCKAGGVNRIFGYDSLKAVDNFIGGLLRDNIY
jgi:hypothetical protein